MTTLSDRLMHMLSMLQDMMDGTSGIMRIAFCHINNIMSDLINDLKQHDEYHQKLQVMYDDKCRDLETSEMNLKYYKKKLAEALERNDPMMRTALVKALEDTESNHSVVLTGDSFDRTIDCLMVDNLIGAIKEWRQNSSHGLKEAKEAIEEVCYAAGTRKRPS